MCGRLIVKATRGGPRPYSKARRYRQVCKPASLLVQRTSTHTPRPMQHCASWSPARARSWAAARVHELRTGEPPGILWLRAKVKYPLLGISGLPHKRFFQPYGRSSVLCGPSEIPCLYLA